MGSALSSSSVTSTPRPDYIYREPLNEEELFAYVLSVVHGVEAGNIFHLFDLIMRVVHLFAFITLSSLTSAWPRPDDFLEAVPDLGSIFDIFSWPATVEEAFTPPESAECPVDGNLGTPPDSGSTEGDQLDSVDDYLLDTNLFSILQTMKENRVAPPCGPDGTHFLVCCMNEWGAPGFLSSCLGGTCDRNFST